MSKEPLPVAGKAEAPARVRRTEKEKTWYRTERVFTVNSRWYFHTREGMDIGPYGCQFDAELELDLLIKRLRDAPQEQCMGIVRSHVLDAETIAGSLNSAAFTDYLVAIGGVELLRRSD